VLHADAAAPPPELREADAEIMLERERLPTLGQIQEVPDHGELRLGGGVLEIVPADGLGGPYDHRMTRIHEDNVRTH
jgi:hypothetical protein